jgi:putative DNA primase/helicase
MVALTTPKPKPENKDCNLYSPYTGFEHLNDLNDTGNAQRFLFQFGSRIKFVAGAWQKWLIWNGKCWQIDTTCEIERMFKSSVRAAIELQEQWLKENDDWKNKPKKPEAAPPPPKDGNPVEQKAYEDGIKMLKEYDNSLRELKAYSEAITLLKYLKSSLNSSKIAAGLQSAQSESVTISHDVLNQTKGLLVCSNGTINLATGLLQESNPDDLLTSHIKTKYNEEATYPKWTQFLKEIFITEDGQPDESLIEFMQKLFGCAVTGLAPRENVFPILYGAGGNGKSTLLKVIQTILGDDIAYGCDPSFLCESKANQHLTSIASTFGKKLVLSQEPPAGARLNTSLIKSFSGGDQMTARRMFEDEWQFYPECLLLYSTNEKPEVKEATQGIWRRVRLIPFLASFTAGTENRKLAQVLLEEESEGILCWIIAGAKAYLADGLKCPERILTETAKYQNEEDIVAGWLDDCCTIYQDTAIKTRASDVQASFKKWCELNNVRSNKKDLADGLKKRGITSLKSTQNWWLKIKINPDDPE